MEQAARLAGAERFIEKLPSKMNTYLTRAVPDAYSGAIEGTKTYESLRVAAGIHQAGNWTGAAGLSGGEMQRLAV